MSNISNEVRQKLNSLMTEQELDEVVAAFCYNLDGYVPNETAEGIIAFDGKRLMNFCSSELVCSIDADEISELVTDMGVGCIFVSYRKKSDDSIVFLCRNNLTSSKAIVKWVRRINHYLDDGKMPEVLGREAEKCPKCGRPFPPGSTVCVHCSDKKKLISRTWELFKPYKLFVFSAVIMFFVISTLNMLMPYINRISVDNYIQNPNPEEVSMSGFVLVMLSLLVLELVNRVLSTLRQHLLIAASSKMIVDLRNKLFDKIQRLSISKISERTAGDLMRRVTDDTGTVNNFVVNYLPSVLEQLAVFVVVGVYLLLYDPVLFLLIMLPTPFVVMSFRLFWRFMHSLFRKRWLSGSRTNTILHDIFSGIRVVKAFGMEHRESARFEEATRQEKELQEKTDCLWSLIMPVLKFFISFGEFIILFYVGNKILGKEMTLGQMSQFSIYASMVYGPLRMVAHIPRHFMNFTTSAAKVFEILDENEDVCDAENPKEIEIEGNIEIKNVSFGYDSGREVLHKVNAEIKHGEFIGIVGASGAGKSTLINLIMRMYDVEDGSISVDGVDIRDISQETLRSNIGVVLQETFLFSGTIYQNIAYAKKGATRKEVIAVAKLAGCHDFITRMPDGYNTKVGERGNTLSGGEKQRIAIARALLHDPKILILDEATASLDTETEKQLQDALARLSEKRTTIAIAHRLSTLRNATRLIVLDKGNVVETGTHDELMALEGFYYGLVMAQREMSNMNN